MNKTRIIKHGPLREKINQEIKLLRLKESQELNKDWIPLFDHINNIDEKIFLNANQAKNQLFPAIKPFLQNKNKQNNKKITAIITNLKEFETKSKNFQSNIKTSNKTLHDYVPQLTNERFLRQKHKNIVYEMSVIDEIFASQTENTKTSLKQSKITNITKQHLIGEILNNNKEIEKHINNIEKIIIQNKKSTVWIFIFSIIIICCTLGALVAYFLINIK